MKKTKPDPRHPRQKRHKLRGAVAGTAAFVVFLALAIAGHDKGFAIPFTLFSKNNPQPEAAVLELQLPEQERGNIYDRNYRLLAGSYRTTAIYARPLEIVDLVLAAEKIAPLLGLSEKELLITLKSERAFVWLGRRISPDMATRIAALDLAGIYPVEEMNRVYPHRTVAAHTLGFVSKNQGLDGVEFYYDTLLRGGRLKDLKLPLRLEPADIETLADKGGHLVLTLDLESQKILEARLASLIEKSGALSGAGLVMDPETGAILAMASLPGFDPNRFWDFTSRQRRNRTLEAAFPLIADKVRPDRDRAAAGRNAQTTATRPLLLLPAGKKTRLRPGRSLSLEIDNPLFEMDRYFITAPVFRVDLPRGAGLSSAPSPPTASSRPLDLSPTTASPLELLSAFVSLVNQGQGVTPHLLSGILAPESKRVLTALPPGRAVSLLDPATRERLWQEMAVIGTPGPDNSLLFEELDSNPSAGLAHGLLLGIAPQQKPELALLLLVNFARADKTSGDSLRSLLDQAGRGIVPRLLSRARVARPELPPDFWRRDQQPVLDLAGRAGRPEQEEPGPGPEKQQFTMPLVNGKSLRCGLQAIQDIGARVKVIGSGLIVAQHPRAGALISKGELCILKLEARARD
ncbi:MAG: hypothetical protein L3J03_04370 [Desulfobacterales bacterium]|nr:hypothetical protein [Desulfobacterales bacterium]